jgi:hypothetical protein
MRPSLRQTARQSALALACLTVAGVLVAGCPPAVPLPDLRTLTDAQATARVHQAAARRERMVGTVKARLPGLEGVVMNATLDVAVEPRARLSVAVRSFFEQPMQMLVTDGTVVTVFDATQGGPIFRRGAVNARAVSLLLPIPLWPHEVVQVFLARPPPGIRGRLVGVDEKQGTYDVWFEPAGEAPFQLTVRAADDAIVRWQHFKRDGRALLDVSYGDLKSVALGGGRGEAVLPFAWSLTLVDREPKETLLFTATDVIFNGPPLPEDAFRLDPPANVPLLPL